VGRRTLTSLAACAYVGRSGVGLLVVLPDAGLTIAASGARCHVGSLGFGSMIPAIATCVCCLGVGVALPFVHNKVKFEVVRPGGGRGLHAPQPQSVRSVPELVWTGGGAEEQSGNDREGEGWDRRTQPRKAVYEQL